MEGEFEHISWKFRLSIKDNNLQLIAELVSLTFTFSYRELSPKQIFQLHENEKKRQYSRRVLEVEQGTFTPLVFTSTGGMADECKRFHSRLAELLALKKGDDYATTISWIRAKVSFAILRSALLCLRGTRSKRRAANISDIDITSESAQARI